MRSTSCLPFAPNLFWAFCINDARKKAAAANSLRQIDYAGQNIKPHLVTPLDKTATGYQLADGIFQYCPLHDNCHGDIGKSPIFLRRAFKFFGSMIGATLLLPYSNSVP